MLSGSLILAILLVEGRDRFSEVYNETGSSGEIDEQ